MRSNVVAPRIMLRVEIAGTSQFSFSADDFVASMFTACMVCFIRFPIASRADSTIKFATELPSYWFNQSP